MEKFRDQILSVVFLFILLLLHPQVSNSQNKVKNIVMFFSFGPNLPAYQNFLEGFNSSFSQNLKGPYNLVTEYLDIGRLENDDYAKSVIGIYNNKYKNTDIDLIVTPGPGIIPVLENNGLEALKKTPVINLDFYIQDRVPMQTSVNKNILDIILKFRISSTLKTAFDLFPDYKNVFVISGNSAIDLYFKSIVDQGKTDFEQDHRFTFISGMTIDSTLQAVREIPVNSIVIVPSFLSDKKHTPFSTPEALNIIVHSCKAPVFPVTDSFIKKEGGIGGYIFSYTNTGKETGRIAAEILAGKSPDEIIVNENSFYQYIFDWQELKKWNLLDSKAIPGSSIFYNRDISFFTQYEWYIAGFLLFLISQTILIMYLFRLNRKQKELTEHMMETENMHRELLREDRLAKMTELTASLSHELNQPLTAILYNAQAGNRFLQSGKLDPKQASEIFNNIIEDDKRAGAIIGSVRSLMKIDIREKENVNLNSLILETIEIIHSDAIRQRVRIKLNLENEQVWVFGDKVQLQQVLLNIIRNAVNAIENNDPENKIIEINLVSGRSEVTVSVRDFGPGIDLSIKEKLFKPFFTTSQKGFGIGLALSRSIIESHRGKIWAENMDGGGARFSFSLRISE